MTLALADQSLEFIKQKKFDELKGLIELEKTNNQLTNFCERILNKKGLDEPIKTNFLYVIMWNLEKIGDDYKYICEHSAAKKISKSTIELYDRVNKLLRNYYELFYKFDVQKLSNLSDDFRKLSKDIEVLLSRGEDAIVLSHLYHVALKTVDFSASTFALYD